MSNTLRHYDTFPDTPDTGDADKCGRNAWVHEHIFSGGGDGQLLARDSAESDGASWIDLREVRERTYLLRDWIAQRSKIIHGTTTQAVLAWIGDSWATQGNITTPLITQLRGIFGNAGAGYVGANDASVLPSGITRTVLGTWVHGSGSSCTGVSLTDMTSVDIGTPATLQFVTTATDFVIHYIKQSGGGKFTYAIDGGAPTLVDTANATTASAQVTIAGLSNASHTLLLTVTVAGSAGVTIDGVDCQIAVAGVRVHHLGFTGTSSADWAAPNVTRWEASLTALAPNIVVIQLGVNDQGASLTPAAYAANLTTLVARIRVAMPHADVLLVSAGDTGVASPTYAMSAYASALRALAVTLSAAYVDAYKVLGDYATANTRALYSNTTHVNAAGGAVLADIIGGVLCEGVPLEYGAYFDLNGVARGNVTIGTLALSVLNLSGNLNLAATSFLQWAGRIALSALATSKLRLENYAETGGVTLDLSTAGSVTVRDQADTADAQIAAASERGNGVTVANLPATPVLGMMATVTDATVTTVGTIVVGGSTHKCLVWYDGTNWRIAVGT